MNRRLQVSLDFGSSRRRLGTLGWDHTARVAAFEWDAQFLAAPLPVSPLLIPTPAGLLRPTSRAFEGLPGLFGDSLPDGWGRLLLDRELRAKSQSLTQITSLDRLAVVGSAGMGALVYEPDEAGIAEDDIDLDWFGELVPQVEEGATAEELVRLRRIGGSSQGARPKFVAQLSPDCTVLRNHRAPCPADWRAVLVKRAARNDPDGAVEAELAYAAMARAAGIEMRETRLLRAASGEAYFATDRFDRAGAERLHMQTIAALLEADFRTTTLDYAEMIKAVRLITRDLGAVEQMFRRMVFNIRALNRDDHLKNHALLMTPQGVWQLAPAYDLSYSLGPGGEHSLLVGGEGRAPGRAAIGRVAASAGLKSARVQAILNEVDGVLADWPRFAETFAVPRQLRNDISADLARARRWD